jgi:hypothetical protein
LIRKGNRVLFELSAREGRYRIRLGTPRVILSMFRFSSESRKALNLNV